MDGVLLLFLNATQHKFIHIHTTRAPLSRGELFDGPCNPAGPGLRPLGRIDPEDPIATTDGGEVLPQRLRLVGTVRATRRSAGIVGSGSGPKITSFTVSPASAPAPSRMAVFTRSQWLPDVLGSKCAPSLSYR